MFNVTVYFVFRSLSVFVNCTAIVSMKNHFILNYYEIMVHFTETYETNM